MHRKNDFTQGNYEFDEDEDSERLGTLFGDQAQILENGQESFFNPIHQQGQSSESFTSLPINCLETSTSLEKNLETKFANSSAREKSSTDGIAKSPRVLGRITFKFQLESIQNPPGLNTTENSSNDNETKIFKFGK